MIVPESPTGVADRARGSMTIRTGIGSGTCTTVPNAATTPNNGTATAAAHHRRRLPPARVTIPISSLCMIGRGLNQKSLTNNRLVSHLHTHERHRSPTETHQARLRRTDRRGRVARKAQIRAATSSEARPGPDCARPASGAHGGDEEAAPVSGLGPSLPVSDG